MKLRRITVALSLAAALGVAAATYADEGPVRPWTIVYVMSYDNDLEKHGAGILEALERGVHRTENAVAVLADFRDKTGLRRIAISSDGRHEEVLPTDDSTSAKVLGEYLDWVVAELPAQRYAVIFLDHGGGLDEMCWDWRPASGEGHRWMSAREAAPEVARFRKDRPGDVELLYLQQCGRGSVENLWLFRDAAPWILASQTRVGAPNTYYERFLQWLAKNPEASGKQVARRIGILDQHYATLTLVDAAAAAELADRLTPVVTELRGTSDDPAIAPAGPEPCYGGVKHAPETSVDLLGWLTAAAGGDKAAQREVKKLRQWVTDELIVEHRVGPIPSRAHEWCGVSLFVPVPKDVRGRNEGHPFLAKTGLDRLWTELYPAD